MDKNPLFRPLSMFQIELDPYDAYRDIQHCLKKQEQNESVPRPREVTMVITQSQKEKVKAP